MNMWETNSGGMSEWDQDAARTEPVDDSRCLWCKHKPADDVEMYHIEETGEAVCEHCLGDAREFKRFKLTELFVADGLEPATRRILLTHWQNARDELVDLYEDDDYSDLFPLPAAESNAQTYEQHPPDTREDGGSSTADRD